MSKKILLLGGTGAMGGYLVNLIDKQDLVYVTSRSTRKDYDNVHYIQGNARDLSFLIDVLREKWDAIVDFMNWGHDEFLEAHKILLTSTNHYIFLSSCRVFANYPNITESTPRLLDVSEDMDFLKTQRYAVRKAREENMLTNSGYNNYTIVRPYITFSNNRLQLGIYEKEQWLSRALQRKPVYITKGILDNYTTLTYGVDVAKCLALLINRQPLSAAVNISTCQSVKWREVLDLYQKAMKDIVDIELIVEERDNIQSIEDLYEGGYNTKYDRLWNRTFDNKLAAELFGVGCVFEDSLVALDNCIRECLEHPELVSSDDEFNNIMDVYEKENSNA